jgi:hypothetical protein
VTAAKKMSCTQEVPIEINEHTKTAKNNLSKLLRLLFALHIGTMHSTNSFNKNPQRLGS